MVKSSSSKEENLFSRHFQSTTWASFLKLSFLKLGLIDEYIHFSLIPSYLQLFFLSNQVIRKHIPKDETFISKIFDAMEKFFTFDNLFSYDKHDDGLIFVCGFILSYFFFVIINFSVVVYKACEFHQNQKKFFSDKVWSLILNLHSPVMFLPISNVLIRIISEFKDNNLMLFENRVANEIIFYISIAGYILNVLLAAVPCFFFFNVLPKQNTLSSKAPFSERSFLCERLLISLLGGLFPEISLKVWLVVSLGFITSCTRQFWFIYCLPRYHFKALHMELYLIRFYVTSVTVSLAIILINEIPHFQIYSANFIMIQVGLSFISSVFCGSFFKKIILNLFYFQTEKLNPYRALHKLLIFKFLRKNMKTFNQYSKKVDLYYLYFASTNVSIEKIFGEKSLASNNFSLNEKKVRNHIKRCFLEKLVSQFSSNHTLKLILAHFYAQNLHLFTLAIKTLFELRSPSFTIKASTHLLHLQIQEQVIKESTKNSTSLKLYNYITTKAGKTEIREEIRQQLHIQKRFWNEYNQIKPDLRKLQQLSEKVHHQKVRVQKNWSRMERNSNDNIHPFYLIYGCYQVLLNNSFTKGEEYLQKYNLFNERYKKILEQKSSIALITTNNISSYFTITLRTDQDHLGTIINCSRSIKKSLGYEASFLAGSNIKNIMSPYIATRHNNYMDEYIKSGVSSFFGKTQTVFLKNRSGFMQKASLVTSIHPFVRKEVYLTGLFQIIEEPLEYIFITPNGEIDSYTEQIGLKLGLINRKIDISEISPRFAKINNVFNTVALNKFENNIRKEDIYYTEQKETVKDFEFTTDNNLNTITDVQSHRPLLISPKKSIKMNLQLLQSQLYDESQKDDEETYENYSNIGQKLEFISLIPPIKKLCYICKVQIQLFRNGFMKVVEIEMNNKEKNSQKFEEEIKWIKTEISQIKPIKETTIPEKNSRFQTLEEKLPSSNPVSEKNENNNKLSSPNIFKKSEALNYSLSMSSGSNTHKRKQIYVDQSLEARYYPCSIYAFLIFFFFTCTIILITQIGLPILTRSFLSNIKDLKTTFDLANSEADTFTNIDLQIRSTYAAESGYISLPFIISTVRQALYAEIPQTVSVLKETNYNLNIVIRNLNKAFQRGFISNDIKIYDNYNANLTNYRHFDMFSAVNILIQKLLQLRKTYSQTKKFGVENLGFFLMNSANDVLERVINTVGTLLSETQSSVSDTLTIINILQLIGMSLNIIGMILTPFFTYFIYKTESDFLEQSINISAEIVKVVEDRIIRFENSLDAEDFDLDYFDINNGFEDEKRAGKFGKPKGAKVIKSPRKNKIKLHYIKQVSIFLSIVLIYLAVITFPYRNVYNKVKVVGQKIDRLAITQAALYEKTMIAFTLGQLASDDKTGLVANKPAEQELKFRLESLINKINGIFNAFKEEDGSTDPETAPILLEDACKYVRKDAKSSCETLSQESKTLGVLSLIAKFHSLASQIYEDYKVSSKSLTYLKRMSLNIYTNLGSYNYVLRDALLTIIEKIRIDFNQVWDDTDHLVHIFIYLDIVFLFGVMICLWKVIVSSFIESIQRFKRMLRIIPADILLNNPELKRLLRLISINKQDLIKLEP